MGPRASRTPGKNSNPRPQPSGPVWKELVVPGLRGAGGGGLGLEAASVGSRSPHAPHTQSGPGTQEATLPCWVQEQRWEPPPPLSCLAEVPPDPELGGLCPPGHLPTYPSLKPQERLLKVPTEASHYRGCCDHGWLSTQEVPRQPGAEAKDVSWDAAGQGWPCWLLSGPRPPHL